MTKKSGASIGSSVGAQPNSNKRRRRRKNKKSDKTRQNPSPSDHSSTESEVSVTAKSSSHSSGQSSTTFQVDQCSYDMQKALNLIRSTCTHKSSLVRDLAIYFRDYGGYILKINGKVVAAAIVEINHERFFQEGSKDNHFCAIIHFHSPFGKHFNALLNMMENDFRKKGLMKNHRFMYYALQPLGNIKFLPSMMDDRTSFLKSFKFESGDKWKYDNVTLIPSHFLTNMFEKGSGPGFFDIARKQPIENYDLVNMHCLPVMKARIHFDARSRTHKCGYKMAHFPWFLCNIDSVPEQLNSVQSCNPGLSELKRVCDLVGFSNRTIPMNIRRSGSIPIADDERCCSYDCVWKMLKQHPMFQNHKVASNMVSERNDNHTNFQDLEIWNKKKNGEKQSLQQIMQRHGYEFKSLKTEEKKKVPKSDLLSEILDSERVGMFICNLICEHKGDCHTVSIAKDSQGVGMVYDANIKHPLELSVKSLSECLGSSRCIGMDLVVELVMKREKKRKNQN